MLTKESKMRILENFYAIDLTLFGKPAPKLETCCPETIKEFVTVKGALLSVMVEMHKLTDHMPDEINEQVTNNHLKEHAVYSAKLARKNARSLVITDKGRSLIKEEIRKSITEGENSERPLEELVEDKIREKTFSLAIDNLLVGRLVSEAVSYENLNEWEGQILEDAYKVLRDSMVEVAVFIDEYGKITR